jgi:hypothetical protein
MDLINFVQETIVSGVAGSAAYDGLKMILGKSYEKLSTYLKNNETSKFEAALDILFSENEELRKQIERLQKGENIQNIVQNNVYGDNIAGDKIDKSVSIGGSNSGIVITGDNNEL